MLFYRQYRCLRLKSLQEFIVGDEEGNLLKRVVQLVPAPTLVGFVLSLIALLIGVVFGVSIHLTFFTLLTVPWLWLVFSEYKLSAGNLFIIWFLAVLGHIPVFLISLIWF